MTLDLQVFTTPSSNVPLTFSLGNGKTSTGIASLAQRLVLRILTPRGNAFGQPNFGTNLLTDLRGGRYRTEQAIRRLWASTRLDLLAQAQRDEVNSDVQLRDIVLTSVSVLADQVTLRLTVTSTAGDAAVFNLNL